MPTPTYDLIEEQVLSSAAPSVTFNSIPGTYKDLVLEVQAGSSASPTTINPAIRVNGDSGSNYSWTYLLGDGTSALSGRSANQTYAPASSAATTLNGMGIMTLFSYANTNVYKTFIARYGSAGADVYATVSMWRNTNAITSITLYANDAGAKTFLSGSTFRLYGIAG